MPFLYGLEIPVMRRKIQDLIRGKFEYDSPVLLFDQEELCFSVIEKEDYCGSFRIQSSSDRSVRGIVTCENPHIQVETAEFEGTSAEIRFTYFGSQAAEGEEETGCFVVTASCGEYLLPYRAQMTRHYLPSSIGRIKTLNDFTNLASLNWEEALKVFASPFFCNIFHENAEFYTLLYHGLTEIRCSSHEMEEFLIASGKKKRARFSLETHELNFQVGEHPSDDLLKIRKSEWGNIDIHISCDASFVKLEKKQLQMYDFRGKHTEVLVQIIPRLMHRGRNYAVITLENCFQKEEIVITAVSREESPEHTIAWKRRQIDAAMEKAYIACRLGEKTGPEWKEETLELIGQARELQPDSRWLTLCRAFVYLSAGELDSAKEQLAEVPRNIRSARTPLGAFYQYLSAWRDGETGNDLLAKIKEVHLKHRGHPLVSWILFQTDESLQRNPGRKYQAIRRFMTESGCTSPVFFLEAALILKENPELLNSQEAFDYRMIGWMIKHNLLTGMLSLLIQSMAVGQKTFSRSYMRVLTRCYKQFGDGGIVKTICVYLIHTNRYGQTFFPWFQRGIEQKLKIAGLYEAYLLSWSRAMGELPKEVIRYFSMNSSLPARKKAMLFAYIVRNRRRLEKDWPAYMVMVKNFAVKELCQGHMNDDLAIIYEELRRMTDRQEWDQIKKESECCYKVHTMGGNVSAVRVLQNVPETVRQRTVSQEGQAYIYLYRRPYVILYEDTSGVLYTTKDGCRLSKMLTGNSIYGPENDRPLPESGEIAGQKADYDAARLSRMAGSIDEMTDLLLQTASGKQSFRLACAQQIMVRMLFTGYLGERHGEIFQILLEDPESEGLLTAYVTILSRSFLMKDYPLQDSVYHFLGEQISRHGRLNLFCETAFLKRYLSGDTEAYKEIAERILKRNLFEGIYFDFYEEIAPDLRRKYLLMNLSVATCFDAPDRALYIMLPGGVREAMREVLPGMYTFPLRILPGERISYSIVDVDGNVQTAGDRERKEPEPFLADTRTGRLAAFGDTRLDTKAQYEYAKLSDMADALFIPVKE